MSRRRAAPLALAAVLAAMPMAAVAAPACVQHSFAADQGSLAYWSCGAGAPVVIVPGGPGLDASYMRPVAEMVAREGRRAILLEPRGTGLSRQALGDGSALTVAGSVADIEALRAALGEGRITVLGHSFGGAVAQAYGAAHPGRVEKLILLSSVGTDMRPVTGQARTVLDSWRVGLTPSERAAYDAMRARGERIAAMRLKFLANFHHRDRGEAFLAALPDTAIHMDVAPLSDDYIRRYDVAQAASRAPFSVVIVAGDMDWIRGYEPSLRAAYPRARLRVVRHAGHFPWADAPAATRRALQAALRD